MNASLKRKIRKFIAPIRRIGLKNKSFTIISNNCWGGVIYDIYGLKYQTPTIGLYFQSSDYIRFLKNIKYYLSIEMNAINPEESKYFNQLTNKNTIIGKIDDIEVFFVHYHTANEAIEKWNKRRKRVNFDNIVIKFNDQNNFNVDDLNEYRKLDFDCKLFFTANKDLIEEKNDYYFKAFKNDGYVVNDIKKSLRVVPCKKILNSLKKENV